jgi:hypothetical protein
MFKGDGICTAISRGFSAVGWVERQNRRHLRFNRETPCLAVAMMGFALKSDIRPISPLNPSYTMRRLPGRFNAA